MADGVLFQAGNLKISVDQDLVYVGVGVFVIVVLKLSRVYWNRG
jgi:hypothetical protein